MAHTPDSWDQISKNTEGFSNLNVTAPAFVPNVNAPAFVPNFGGKFSPTSQVPSTIAVSENNSEQDCNQSPEAIAANKMHSNGEITADSWEDNADDEPTDEEPTENGVIEETPEEHESQKETCSPEVKTEPVSIKATKKVVPEQQPVKETKSSKKNGKVDSPEPEKTDERENINIIFIGHVDAGKSTIGGQLLFLTGQVDKRTLEKYEREAKEKNRETWYLSWALDTNLEERDKGKTVECGRASFDTESKHFVLLDAPGHKSFVPNMIGGAAQADVAILVISARKGEFETGFERGGQTREHAMLAKTAGVKFLIILVNKMDDPTVKWDQGRYKDIVSKLTPYLKKTGFKSSDMTFMPCSGFTGANLKNRVEKSVCPWFNGPSFLEFLDHLPDFKWPFDDPVKILISDRYKDMGTIVIAKVESGTCKKGDSYVLMPNKQNVKVVGITGADELDKNSCRAGENVKLKLSGVEEEEVLPGFILCPSNHLCTTGQIFDAQVVILEHKSIICAGYKAVLHIHNAVEEVTLVGLIHTIDRKTGEKSAQRPRFIKQDSVAIARFRTENLICMETFANFQPMGRFTLRDEGKSIAIGKVLAVRHKKESHD